MMNAAMRSLTLPLAVGLVLSAGAAHAQQPQLPPPAPPPPPAQNQPPPGQYQPPPPGYGQPQYGGYQGQPYYQGQQPYYQGQGGQVPPPQYPVPPEPDTHAPKYSLWVGARLSFIGYGLSFYQNEANQAETTGNYVGNGVGPQLNVGARLGYRYIPYVFWEHGFMGKGHRFEGAGPGLDATSSTESYGIGLRHVSGDVDSVGFLTDISFGLRKVTVENDRQAYTLSGLEFFRLGLGAEIRVATLFSVTPLLGAAFGAFNDTEGDIQFKCAPGCSNNINGPTYKNGETLGRASNGYVVLTIGVGLHFDVFGK
jgi:hypothetical protein